MGLSLTRFGSEGDRKGLLPTQPFPRPYNDYDEDVQNELLLMLVPVADEARERAQLMRVIGSL